MLNVEMTRNLNKSMLNEKDYKTEGVEWTLHVYMCVENLEDSPGYYSYFLSLGDSIIGIFFYFSIF